MRSPIASRKQMNRVQLEDGLLAYQCPETDGIFLPVVSYFQWLGKQRERLPLLPLLEDSTEEALVDSQEVKICPESGQLMQRYRVGHGFAFHVDRSPSGSLWFDKGEWESLRKRQYHDELHLIFTSSWQRAVRNDDRKRAEAELLADRLGEDLVMKLDEIGRLIADNDYGDMALAYLHRKNKREQDAAPNT